MGKKIFRNLTEEKIDAIKEELIGLDKMEWLYIKQGIDMYFNAKAANLKIDDLGEINILLKRKY